jgi:hypothetical protein
MSTLCNLGGENNNPNNRFSIKDEPKTVEKTKEEQIQYEYKLLGKFRGHKNNDPPTIYYVPQSGCLISGEKHLNE